MSNTNLPSTTHETVSDMQHLDGSGRPELVADGTMGDDVVDDADAMKGDKRDGDELDAEADDLEEELEIVNDEDL